MIAFHPFENAAPRWRWLGLAAKSWAARSARGACGPAAAACAWALAAAAMALLIAFAERRAALAPGSGFALADAPSGWQPWAASLLHGCERALSGAYWVGGGALLTLAPAMAAAAWMGAAKPRIQAAAERCARSLADQAWKMTAAHERSELGGCPEPGQEPEGPHLRRRL